MMDRRILGARAKAQGQAFEDLLSRSFEALATQGRAVICKTPEPMRPVRRLRDGQYIAVFAAKAQVDFSGTLAGGRAVRIEAKYTTADRIEVGRIQARQAADLDAHTAMGALCLVVVGFSAGDVFAVPWTEWRRAPEVLGRRYIKRTEFAAATRVPRFCGGLVDVLAAGEEKGAEDDTRRDS